MHTKSLRKHLKTLNPYLEYLKRKNMQYKLKTNNPLSKRGQEWLTFAEEVLTHTEVYTVPQYGDLPDDQASKWTAQDCITAILKYGARFGTNSRSGQGKLDIVKIAHYACLAHNKLEDVEPMVTITQAEYDELRKR